MSLITAFGIIAAFGMLAYIRLAPSDPAVWHIEPAVLIPDAALSAREPDIAPAATNGPVNLPGGSFAIVVFEDAEAGTVMRNLDVVAQRSTRTTLLAGTPEQGHMTWVTRSRLLGFPDYTTAKAMQVDQNVHLLIVARQRFGREDLGVNSRRLSDWLAKLLP